MVPRVSGGSEVSMTARKSAFRCWLAFCLVVCLGGVSARAAAETSTQNRAAAEALFNEASQLFKDGKYEAACTKLAKSQELDPAVGTLLNLGRCYEKIGKTASAWLAFVEAASGAKAAGQAERAETARANATRLEPVLPKLLIQVPDEVNVEGLAIRRNGEAVPPALWNQSSPADPGDQTIEVSAPGKKPWSASVKLEPAKEASVLVPVLENAPVAGPAPDAPPPATEGGSGLGTQRIIAIAVAGVGVASVGAGAVFGLSAMSDADTANENCSGSTCSTQAALDANEDALSKATLSTVFFSAGAALVAGGAVLWFTAPKRGAEPQRGSTTRPGIAGVSPLLGRGAQGIVLDGRF
jgi:hypothetical protein